MQKNHILTFTGMILFVLLLLLANIAFSSDDKKKTPLHKPDPEVCLEISGNLSPDMRSIPGGYVVMLIQNNKVIEQIEVNGKEKFKLHLKRNTRYSIRVEKNGFISRLVSVCTNLPENARVTNLYRFHFDIHLFSDAFAKYFDPDDIDFPVALIAYDEKQKLFNYDKSYTEQVQQKMHSMSSAGKE